MSDKNPTLFNDKNDPGGRYHNTVPLDGNELNDAQERAFSQYNDTKQYFKENPQDDRITPERVYLYLLTVYPARYKKSKMESIRRVFSDLKRNEIIEKSGHKVKGNYDTPVNCWRLRYEHRPDHLKD